MVAFRHPPGTARGFSEKGFGPAIHMIRCWHSLATALQIKRQDDTHFNE